MITWQGPLNLPAGHLGIVGTDDGVQVTVRLDDVGRLVFASDGAEVAVPQDLARALATVVLAATGDTDDLVRDFDAARVGLADRRPS